MTISQLIGHIRYQDCESLTPDTGYRALTIVRRCLIWTAITLVASWIISSHVLAEEITTAPEPGEVIGEKFIAPMQAVGCAADGAANASRIIAGPSGNYTFSGAMDPRHSEYFQSLALTTLFTGRASEQISSRIDPDQIPPSSSSSATQPAFSWNDSDYWAQGLNFGLEARF